MQRPRLLHDEAPHRSAPAKAITLAIALCLLAATGLNSPAQAQTFQVLHNFTGGADGSYPTAGLTMDEAGNLYGATAAGPANSSGVVVRLAHKNSSWLLTPLYAFGDGYTDANYPTALSVGPDGTLYGATAYGGGGEGCGNLGCGTVFNLRPRPSICHNILCSWNLTTLHVFEQVDGWQPTGILTFDQTGSIYGETAYTADGGGEVYRLVRSADNWQEETLWAFGNPALGDHPAGGVVFGADGSLYGVAGGGQDGKGSIFRLVNEGMHPSLGEQVLYSFRGEEDGSFPRAAPLLDASGHLFGTTCGFPYNGTIFELTSTGSSASFSLLYTFDSPICNGPAQPTPLLFRSDGAILGATVTGGAYEHGNIFKLTPTDSGWIYSSLHDFTGGTDGAFPSGVMVLDANGNLYGLATYGGTGPCSTPYGNGCGLVWEMTP